MGRTVVVDVVGVGVRDVAFVVVTVWDRTREGTLVAPITKETEVTELVRRGDWLNREGERGTCDMNVECSDDGKLVMSGVR